MFNLGDGHKDLVSFVELVGTSFCDIAPYNRFLSSHRLRFFSCSCSWMSRRQALTVHQQWKLWRISTNLLVKVRSVIRYHDSPFIVHKYFVTQVFPVLFVRKVRFSSPPFGHWSCVQKHGEGIIRNSLTWIRTVVYLCILHDTIRYAQLSGLIRTLSYPNMYNNCKNDAALLVVSVPCLLASPICRYYLITTAIHQPSWQVFNQLVKDQPFLAQNVLA